MSRSPDQMDWSHVSAPSLADFEALAAAAFARLPAMFRDRCANIAFLVMDVPDEETLRALGLEDEYELLGVYQGVDETRASSLATPSDLNRIILFRRPLLDYWAGHEETLGDLVTHVLVHEIGHHFGLSDDDMEAIEASAR
ncbi:MAG: metallopeptidase family protein [Neomegalonema sp.]|nr:metallopeptidase family protein [Neomegalonema sp.]